MVSKSRRQRQKQITTAASGEAPQPATERKSVHLKKVRPHMRHKHKIRLGHTSADVYEGFEDKLGVKWRCQTCGKLGRVIGFCATCAATTLATTGTEAAPPPALGKISKATKKAQAKRFAAPAALGGKKKVVKVKKASTTAV